MPTSSLPPPAKLLLCEAAPSVRAALAARFAGNAKIRVVAPHEIARLPEHSLDLIVLHSVAQYLTPAGAGALFALFHRLLKPGGLLVVSDVIQPQVAAAADAIALLRFGQGQRIFLRRPVGADPHAVFGLLAAALAARPDPLWRSRDDRKLSAAGFAAHRAPANIGHNQARMTFYAKPR